MTEVAISARDIAVSFNPYLEKAPTLRRTIARRRVRERKEVRALGGVSFDILKGEAFGILGRNGAGKSTLLRVLARTLRPDAGTVTVQGRTSTLLQLGVGFNRQLSGRRNIYLGCLANGLSVAQIEDRMDSILAYAELGH
ncbi:MAG: ATP-binding cassette domain-containing protein, partial [Acidimicrobiia bacterium]|nr:ATP-binding cassette domain-containing protein [Acidimicrobiia bacterium]